MRKVDFFFLVVEREKLDVIILEIEVINLDVFFEFEKDGYFVVLNVKVMWIVMYCERMREILVREVKVLIFRYIYVLIFDEFYEVCEKIGYFCYIKVIMSFLGKGFYFVKGFEDVLKVWEEVKKKVRGSVEKFIVEEYIDFDVEIMELVVRYYDENGEVVIIFFKFVGYY